MRNFKDQLVAVGSNAGFSATGATITKSPFGWLSAVSASCSMLVALVNVIVPVPEEYSGRWRDPIEVAMLQNSLCQPESHQQLDEVASADTPQTSAHYPNPDV